MAIEKEIKIKVDTKDAEKSVDKLGDSYDDLVKKLEEVEKAISETTDPKKLEFYKKKQKELNEELGRTSDANKKIGKTAKGASKASIFLSRTIEGIGLALKAVGIGLVIAAFAKMVDVFTNNQKVADGLSTAFKTLSIFLNQTLGVLVNAISTVSEASNGFENLSKVVGGLITISLTPLLLIIDSLKLRFYEAQLAYEQSFLGDNDPTTINKLRENIQGVKDDVKETAQEYLQAGEDIVSGFSGAVNEVTSLGENVINGLKDVSISASFEQAKASTELGKAAILAEASLQGLIEKYDRQAEQLRQIRDDDQKSIADRIKANEELGRILDEQNKEQVKLAKVKVSQAQDELKNNKDNVEAQRALIEAQNEVLAIEAQVEGFRSEQLVNRNSLLREQKDIVKELNEIGKTEAERVKQEAKDLLEERRAKIELQISDEVEKFRLLAEARKDYEDTIAELDAAEQVRIDKIAEEQEKIDKEERDQKIAYAKTVEENKESLLTAGLDFANSQLKQNSNLSKGIAAAQTVFDTQQGITSALAAKGADQLLPFPVRLANAALVGIKGALALKNILKTNPISGSGGTAQNNAGAGGTQAPAFNLTASSGVNQIAGDVQGSEPLRAFVVGSDVTNQQQMDRDTFGQAGLG